MLHLTLLRKWRKPEYTIGQLFAGGRFICNTIEDTDRGLHQYMSAADIAKIKLPGKTAIPLGTYRLAVSPSPKFGRNLIEVLNVPGFAGIRIHRGNTAEDSAGCILPGINSEKGKVTNSTHFEELLTSMVMAALTAGEDVFLTIISA